MKQRLNFAKSYYQHLRKLHLADFSPNSINLAVDTLIGADFNGRSFHVIKRHEGHVLLLIRKLVLFLVVLSMLRKKQLQVPYFSCFKNSKRVCPSIWEFENDLERNFVTHANLILKKRVWVTKNFDKLLHMTKQTKDIKFLYLMLNKKNL